MISFEIKTGTVSEANEHGKLRGEMSRHKNQRELAFSETFNTVSLTRDGAIATRAARPSVVVEPPWIVTVTRVAPKAGLARHDALPGSLKHVVDGVALALFGGRIGEGDDRKDVWWAYEQRKGKPAAVVVTIETDGGECECCRGVGRKKRLATNASIEDHQKERTEA